MSLLIPIQIILIAFILFAASRAFLRFRGGSLPFGAFLFWLFIWGSAAIVWVIYRVNSDIYTQQEHEGLLNIAVYWHMIDLAWITIFPLLYVIR